MTNSRFSWEEFNTLFPGPFESEQERQKEYDAFLLVLEQLDRVPVPALSARERAEIFRRAWPQTAPERPSVWTWLALLDVCTGRGPRVRRDVHLHEGSAGPSPVDCGRATVHGRTNRTDANLWG